MNPQTSQEPHCPGYTLRTHQPGDIGWIIHRHAILYEKEYGWGAKMEALVCKVGAEFLDNYNASTDRCWIAELNDEFLGFIVLVRDRELVNTAKLRLLLVEPSVRGLGLGRALIEQCTRGMLEGFGFGRRMCLFRLGGCIRRRGIGLLVLRIMAFLGRGILGSVGSWFSEGISVSEKGRYLSSLLFTFVVGDEKKEITVYSAAFSGLSQSLYILINGDMIEAKTSRVDWPEVDVDTFTRLCEFAYCRNYTPPSFRLIDGMPPRSNAKQHEYKTRPPKNGHREIPYKTGSVWTKQLNNVFTESLVVPNPQSDDFDPTFTSPQNTGPYEDFTPVFLKQAQLYVIADIYGIERLRQRVLFKLYQTLRTFKLYDMGVSSIIGFLQFVYLNTPPNHNGKLDALMNLATRYIVSVLGQIGGNERFQELLEVGGPFVSDFWNIIWSVA
ncbi:unnamed protein product [Penicillium viridicatum]